MCKLPVTKTYALYFYMQVRYTNGKGRKDMGNEVMASRKIRRNPQSMAIAQAILEQYQPQTREDMQDAS